MDDPEKNRVPFLCCLKLSASFHSQQNSDLSYSPETLNLDQNQQFIVPYDIEIWRKTLQ